MKSLNKSFRFKWYQFTLIAIAGLISFTACNDNTHGELGPPPKNVTFTANPLSSNPNEIAVNNTTKGAFMSLWNFGNGQTSRNKMDTVIYTFKGQYKITLKAFGHGGIDSTSKKVTIDQNDPSACHGTTQGFITGCSQKTWKLNPDAYAEMVGPGPGDGSYFGNSAASVTGLRSCDFNDEWTFSFDAEGKMKYDNKGDFYEDTYIGNGNSVCGDNSELSKTQKPWASGNFHYKVIPNSGVNPKYGQLKVIGLGAHIGLPEAVNGAQNTEAPVKSITYDIINEEHHSGYDILVLTLNSGTDSAPLWWTFTLRSTI
jgi:PKD repeat protein